LPVVREERRSAHPGGPARNRLLGVGAPVVQAGPRVAVGANARTPATAKNPTSDRSTVDTPAVARRARRVGDLVAVRFDPRHGERDPTFDLDTLGVQYTVTLIHDQQTGRAYLEARFALADVEWPF
jgi:hypothetical protein